MPKLPDLAGRSYPIALAVFLILQGIAALFFTADVLSDAFEMPMDIHAVLEAFVTFVLVSSTILSAWQLRLTLADIAAKERALELAAGEFGTVVENQFAEWRLTEAERDVGMLALKGLDVSEIAEMRGRAKGTVRAQLASIYAKAGVAGHPQLVSLFVEELMGGSQRDPQPV